MQYAHDGSTVHPVLSAGDSPQESLRALEHLIAPIPGGVLGMMPFGSRDECQVVIARNPQLVAEIVDVLIKLTGVVEGFLEQLKRSIPRDQARDHPA